ncbi:MAG TPA: four helix bundle protein [Chitinophagaceae bacterium]|nr:four helix bundle protein [Chitinophagaceae bacterium]
MKENLVKTKSFEFALEAIQLYKLLLSKNEFVLSKQFLRAATSIGANIEEADAGQSKRDFIAKISIASKEAREANYWLRLLKASGFIDFKFEELTKKSEELIRILTAIVKTAQSNIKH